MYEKKIARVHECGMGITMEVLGGKWKPCLIFAIHNGLKRPSEIHRYIPAASPRVLNQQLAELEQHGIVEKKIFPVLPPKVEYSLTASGKSLLDIIATMNEWGSRYEKTFKKLNNNIRKAI